MRSLTVLPRLTFFLGQPNFKTGVVRILSISWLLVWYVGICWRPSNPWMVSTHKAVKKSEEISIGSFPSCLYWTSKLCFVFVIHRPYCFFKVLYKREIGTYFFGICVIRIFWKYIYTTYIIFYRFIVMNGKEIFRNHLQKWKKKLSSAKNKFHNKK